MRGAVRSSVLWTFAALVAMCWALGCPSEDARPGDEFEVRATISVTHTREPPAPGFPAAVVRVFRCGAPVTDATVTIDGSALALQPDDTYRATLAVSAGDVLDLSVIDGDISVAGTVTMAGEIAIDAPNMTDGPYDAALEIPVGWTPSSATPDTVTFAVTGWDTVSGQDTFMDFDGAATDAAIPGGTISGGRSLPGPTVSFKLVAVNEASSLEIYPAPGSPVHILSPDSYLRTQWWTAAASFETQ